MEAIRTSARPGEAVRVAHFRQFWRRKPYLDDAGITEPTQTQKILADGVVRMAELLEAEKDPKMILHLTGQVERLVRELRQSNRRGRRRWR